jgi:hypothetical protein
MGGTRRVALALAANVFVGGCVVAYHPVRHHEAWNEGVAARITSLDTVDNLVQISIATRGPPGQRIANAWLTTPATTPCTGGVSPSSLAAGALHADERIAAFDLRAPAAAGLFLQSPTVIDLDFVPGDPAGPRRCLRIGVTDAAPEVEWKAWPRWFVATGLRVIGAPSGPDPVHGGVLFAFGGGVWLGPMRLRLDWLFGEADTSRVPPPGYVEPKAQLIGGDAAVEIFPLHVGWLGVGLQAGYEYLATDFSSQRGSSENDVYDGHGPRGPRVALRLARIPKPRHWPSFSARPDHWSIGLDLFAARWTGLPDLAPMRYGVALSGEWGRWW